jgi:hypothetical protein
MDLNERINYYIDVINFRVSEYWKKCGYTYAPPPVHRAERISNKWVKVLVYQMRDGSLKVSSVHSFICIADGYTKTLGSLKFGDIHMAASFKSPAKHARGNVFSDDFSKTLTDCGSVVYLK